MLASAAHFTQLSPKLCPWLEPTNRVHLRRCRTHIRLLGLQGGEGYRTPLPPNAPTSQPTANVTPIADAGFSVRINFQPASAPTFGYYLADSGEAFGDRGNGYHYGWNERNDHARDRDSALSPDQRFDALNHMQNGGTFTWEVAAPNGNYKVHLVAGDPSYINSVYKIDAEGVRAVDGAPSDSARWLEADVTVTVSDGRLLLQPWPGQQFGRHALVCLCAEVLKNVQCRLQRLTG
ncbi:MAG: hypothetical protein ACRDH2_19090 [Anaerolineales bacterium]